MNRMRRSFMVVGLMLTMATPIFAEEHNADLTFSGGGVAAGIGYTWGDGVLNFDGKEFPFAVHGLSVVDVGVAHIEGSGDVYNLHDVKDFPGNYVSVGAGATLAGGGKFAMLQNQNGVRISFHSTTQGLKLNLSPEGVAVDLK